MKNNNQRIELTKRLLKEGLLRLLKTKPLDKINITELCSEAGINRATFYRHYEVPKDVLTEMQFEFVTKMLDSFNRPLSENDVERFFEYLRQNEDLVRIFFRYNSDADLAKGFNYLYRSIIEQNIFKAEAFNKLDEESGNMLCAYLVGGAYFLVREWIMEDIDKTPKEVAEIALSVIDKKNMF